MADVGVGGLRLATVRTASGTAARAAVIDARAPRTSSAVAHPLPFADGADALRAWAAADAERAARGDARMPPSRMLQEALDACDPAGALPLSDVELLPPVASSRNAFAIGLNYGEHVTEVKERFQGDIVRRERPSHPVVFTKAQTAAVGAGAPIELPPPAVSSEVDYEGELGVVLLRGGKAIEKEHALEHVFGYSVINDVTARDMQRNHQQWHLGKSCDTFMPHGPWVVPRDEVDLAACRVRTHVNGEPRQDGANTDMLFSVPELIATLSLGMTLVPADVIATGTPKGVGSGFDPPRFLKKGDRVTITVDGVGKLENPVV